MIAFLNLDLGSIGVSTAVGLIRVVLAVIVSITDVGWVGTDAGATLELAWSALKLSYGERNNLLVWIKIKKQP